MQMANTGRARKQLGCQAWWFHVILVLERLKEDCHEFSANQSYTEFQASLDYRV